MAYVIIAVNLENVNQHYGIQCSGSGWGPLQGFGGYSIPLLGVMTLKNINECKG